MNAINFIKEELKGFTQAEKIIFPLVIALIIFISFYMNDSKIALLSAVAGICYTILAGKGKISCYFVGMTGTLCYCYIAFQNGFWGNLLLCGLYYFPTEIIGVFKWKKHLKKDKKEIVKTRLKPRERLLCFALTAVIAAVVSAFLAHGGGKNPFMDGFSTTFSVLGQLLTVKRCIEQWYVWFFVNFLSFVMWLFAYFEGSNCLATVLMWLVYLILAVYFLIEWKKEVAPAKIFK